MQGTGEAVGSELGYEVGMDVAGAREVGAREVGARVVGAGVVGPVVGW